MRRQGCCKRSVVWHLVRVCVTLRARFRFEREDTRSQEARRRQSPGSQSRGVGHWRPQASPTPRAATNDYWNGCPCLIRTRISGSTAESVDHVPETHVLRPDNVEMLAQAKRDFVFKPLHGFAGRRLHDSAAVGRARLRRLLKAGEGYVAQRRIAKPCMEVDGTCLWTDLRVWAYRGEIFLISGRASRRPDRLELAPPGGRLPTYVSL